MSFGILGSAAAAAAAAAAASAAVASSASSAPKHTCGCEACMRMTGAGAQGATAGELILVGVCVMAALAVGSFVYFWLLKKFDLP